MNGIHGIQLQGDLVVVYMIMYIVLHCYCSSVDDNGMHILNPMGAVFFETNTSVSRLY